jgi:Voltage gated chloride channel
MVLRPRGAGRTAPSVVVDLGRASRRRAGGRRVARFGSDKIRGHGMPEAIEAILTRGSRIEPKVAILKPVSAAISIGTGGPFGAEGPIIMTGGALGSILAQHLHLTAECTTSPRTPSGPAT